MTWPARGNRDAGADFERLRQQYDDAASRLEEITAKLAEQIRLVEADHLAHHSSAYYESQADMIALQRRSTIADIDRILTEIYS